jgi:N-acetylglucosamine kinase-like BadF-type ATPase
MRTLLSDVVLGVDGGGTWTRSVVMRFDGVILGTGNAGPSNAITIGLDRALSNIIEAVNKAKDSSRVAIFKASVMGLAGASRSKLGDMILANLPNSLGETLLVSDARSALAGATGLKPGVAAIAGTGSISYGINEEGLEAKAGGWGWRLGDEGSGYTIGKNALIAALQDHDESGPKTILKESILRRLSSATQKW